MTLKLKPYTRSLVHALTNARSQLAQNADFRLIIATASRKTLNSQNWPHHVKIIKGKKLGRRVPVRGSRRILTAVWPDDHYEAPRQDGIGYILCGQATLSIADYHLQCQTGDFVFIPQNIPRSTTAHLPPNDSHSQCDILWLRPFSDNRIDLWICHSQGTTHESGPHYGTCFVENTMIVRQFKNLAEEAQEENNSELMCYFLKSILLMFTRDIRAGRAFLPLHHTQDEIESDTGKRFINSIEDACHYINEHLHKPLTAQDVARRACMSLTLFHQKFQEKRKQTFHQYLTNARMAKAAALLRESDLPTEEVARRVGVQYGQLRRLFLKHHQCTPGEYRQKYLDIHVTRNGAE